MYELEGLDEEVGNFVVDAIVFVYNGEDMLWFFPWEYGGIWSMEATCNKQNKLTPRLN